MKYVNEIIPYVKIFLFAYLVIMILPIHHATGLNIQSHIQWAIFGCMQHNNFILVVIRTIIALLFITAYQTKDAMLFCLLLYFYNHRSEINQSENDKNDYRLCK